MGIQTGLYRNRAQVRSLITTVPIHVVKEWDLDVTDRLEWSWVVIENKMMLVVSPAKKHKAEAKLVSSS